MKRPSIDVLCRLAFWQKLGSRQSAGYQGKNSILQNRDFLRFSRSRVARPLRDLDAGRRQRVTAILTDL